MNHPISNHQIGQATHREYEARFGSQHVEGGVRQDKINPTSWHTRVLAFGGLSVTTIIVVLTFLF